MKLKQLINIMLVLVFALSTATAFAAGDNPQPRPFKGTMAGEATFPFNDNCDYTGSPVETLAATQGTLTHLGLSEYFSSHCATENGGAVGGEAVIIAANGDEIWLSYMATFAAPPPIIMQIAEFVVTGGTGRFEGASGLITAMVYITFQGFEDPAWPIEFVFAGTITY